MSGSRFLSFCFVTPKFQFKKKNTKQNHSWKPTIAHMHPVFFGGQPCYLEHLPIWSEALVQWSGTSVNVGINWRLAASWCIRWCFTKFSTKFSGWYINSSWWKVDIYIYIYQILCNFPLSSELSQWPLHTVRYPTRSLSQGPQGSQRFSYHSQPKPPCVKAMSENHFMSTPQIDGWTSSRAKTGDTRELATCCVT